jgi:AraC-like DNA-binding protein
MKLSVSSLTHDDFVLWPVPVDDYPNDILPGSEMNYAEGAFGKIVLQQIAAHPYYILYNYFQVESKSIFQFTGEAPPLRIMMALQGSGHFYIDGIGTVFLEQGQFTIVSTPTVNSTVIFERSADLLMFNLFLPAEILQELAAIFPLADFIRESGYAVPVILFDKPGWISAEAMREITYLLNFDQETFREYLFSLKAKQLLHLLLMQKFYTGRQPISEEMLERIHLARHLIEASVGELLTIEKIAAQAGISPADLKKYFKHAVGYTLPVFITQARLNNAKLLIQETDLPIKQIAHISGYDHEQNFIQAFKKHFDYTPFFLRRRNA